MPLSCIFRPKYLCPGFPDYFKPLVLYHGCWSICKVSAATALCIVTNPVMSAMVPLVQGQRLPGAVFDLGCAKPGLEGRGVCPCGNLGAAGPRPGTRRFHRVRTICAERAGVGWCKRERQYKRWRGYFVTLTSRHTLDVYAHPMPDQLRGTVEMLDRHNRVVDPVQQNRKMAVNH